MATKKAERIGRIDEHLKVDSIRWRRSIIVDAYKAVADDPTTSAKTVHRNG